MNRPFGNTASLNGIRILLHILLQLSVYCATDLIGNIPGVRTPLPPRPPQKNILLSSRERCFSYSKKDEILGRHCNQKTRLL